MSQDDETSRKAHKDLERLSGEGGLTASPALRKAADGIGRHFAASDADQTDASELWGTRIARALAAVFFIGLTIWIVLSLNK